MLIVLEGIDGSGKGTQAEILHEYLKESGYDACLFSFPRYTANVFGRCVGRFLNGEFGPLDQVHPLLASVLYALDRWETSTELKAQLQVRDVVVCDRYVPSNVAHQCAKQPTDEEWEELAAWITNLEYNMLGLPKPDMVIQFDLPVERAQELIAKKGQRDYTEREADIQEANAEYLRGVRRSYGKLRYDDRQSRYWRLVDITRNGHILGVEEVAALVRKIVSPLLSDDDNLSPSGDDH